MFPQLAYTTLDLGSSQKDRLRRLMTVRILLHW